MCNFVSPAPKKYPFCAPPWIGTTNNACFPHVILDVLVMKTTSRTPNYPNKARLECTNPQHAGHLFLLEHIHPQWMKNIDTTNHEPIGKTCTYCSIMAINLVGPTFYSMIKQTMIHSIAQLLVWDHTSHEHMSSNSIIIIQGFYVYGDHMGSAL